VALSAGVSAIGTVALFNGDVPLILSTIGSSFVGPVAKIIVSFPLLYHYLGGVRHVIWDKNPDLLTTDQVGKSSDILFGLSGGFSLAAAFLI
jgi:succinate dehydrogenase (ubiquinone) cytochrome b560 subunit